MHGNIIGIVGGQKKTGVDQSSSIKAMRVRLKCKKDKCKETNTYRTGNIEQWEGKKERKGERNEKEKGKRRMERKGERNEREKGKEKGKEKGEKRRKEWKGERREETGEKRKKR